MGQRLNLEVCYDGEVLANVYYHWSAYTSSSLFLLENVLSAYRKSTKIRPLDIAVEILQATGAGIDDNEREQIVKDTSGKFDSIEFRDATGRNEGILSVTKDGIEDTRRWEEGRVLVDIGAEEFTFGVMWQMSNDDYNGCREDGDAEKLPDTDFDFTAPCPFRDFDKFAKAVNDNPDGVRIDDDTVLCWIE